MSFFFNKKMKLKFTINRCPYQKGGKVNNLYELTQKMDCSEMIFRGFVKNYSLEHVDEWEQ